MTSWIAAGLVGLTLLVLTPIFYHLPNAVLAAIVMVAVAGLIDLRYPITLWKQDRIEAAICSDACGHSTVSLPLGIGVGVLLALALAVRRMMMPHVAVLGNVEGVHRNVERFPHAKTDPKLLLCVTTAP